MCGHWCAHSITIQVEAHIITYLLNLCSQVHRHRIEWGIPVSLILYTFWVIYLVDDLLSLPCAFRSINRVVILQAHYLLPIGIEYISLCALRDLPLNIEISLSFDSILEIYSIGWTYFLIEVLSHGIQWCGSPRLLNLLLARTKCRTSLLSLLFGAFEAAPAPADTDSVVAEVRFCVSKIWNLKFLVIFAGGRGEGTEEGL